MSKEEKYEGNYLESCDLMATPPVSLTIKSVTDKNTEKDSRGKLIKNIVIRFEETDKAFVCCPTNRRLISAQYGSKPAIWIGKKVSLEVRYLDLTSFIGESNVPSIRVLLPAGVAEPLQCRKWMGERKSNQRKES